jgi:hypothetical protein
MSRNRFVEPETVKLDLSDGDWIEVKKELTYGEEQRLAGAAMTSMNIQSDADKAKTQTEEGDGVRVNLQNERFAIARLYTWLVDWSFTNAKGKRVEVSREAIANLSASTAHEIDDALTAYIASREEAAKNAATPTS